MNKFILSVFFLLNLFCTLYGQQETTEMPDLPEKGTAQIDYFEAFGRCCPGNPNYDRAITRKDSTCHPLFDWYVSIF